MNPIFLTAEWRYLAMLNYAVDSAILQPLVPYGTELDLWRGQALVSIVGFHFLRTRVLGLSLPGHRNFEEVNLRFYVRRQCGGEWRRGVVFVRELVPKPLIAWVARTFYGEPYLALPMAHTIQHTAAGVSVRYGWRRQGQEETLTARGVGEPQPLVPGSEEEFITEHYWGYTRRRSRCSEFAVEHPPWRVWRATEHALQADFRTLYGPEFAESLQAPPVSAFIAEGSPVAVRWKTEL